MKDILCHPCYVAIRTAVLAGEARGLLEDISIETAMRFASDFTYSCEHSSNYASHSCLGGRCICLCEVGIPL